MDPQKGNAVEPEGPFTRETEEPESPIYASHPPVPNPRGGRLFGGSLNFVDTLFPRFSFFGPLNFVDISFRRKLDR